jgi:TPR repeat protein
MIRFPVLFILLASAVLAAPPATPAPKPPAKPAPPADKTPAEPAASAAKGPVESDALKKARELAGKKDYEGAIKILRAESARGDAAATNGLGEMTMQGLGVKASPVEALALFQKASDASLPLATFNLSMLLARGAEGVPKNEAKAKFLLRAAAEAGLADAQSRMGQLAEEEATSKPGAPDYAEAYAWYQKAAAQENPGGLYAMMRFADNGYGGPVDPQKATDYCVRAAKAGSILAMNEMGIRYQAGRGLPKDDVAAVGWFSLGAQNGQLAALANLGHCYEVGRGARQDYEIAGQRYAAAARLNFPPGQFLLGHLIEEGLGTKPNPVHAYVLYTRAAEGKVEEAKAKVEELKKKLTPEQLEEADKMLKSGKLP